MGSCKRLEWRWHPWIADLEWHPYMGKWGWYLFRRVSMASGRGSWNGIPSGEIEDAIPRVKSVTCRIRGLLKFIL